VCRTEEEKKEKEIVEYESQIVGTEAYQSYFECVLIQWKTEIFQV